jgi:hypothetical protein
MEGKHLRIEHQTKPMSSSSTLRRRDRAGLAARPLTAPTSTPVNILCDLQGRGYPHTSQIQARHLFQLAQGMDALHDGKRATVNAAT